MKNLIALFTLALLIALTSCTNDTFLQPEIEPQSDIQTEETNTTMHHTSLDIEMEEEIEYTVVNHLQVNKVTYSEVDGELHIDFSSNHDFTSDVLEPDQQLTFVDNTNTEFTYDFTVNSFSGSNGSLSVAYAMNSQDLTGLQLKLTQYIIIVEEIVN